MTQRTRTARPPGRKSGSRQTPSNRGGYLSERYRSALLDRQGDETRRPRHELMGLTVVEVRDHEIFYTPGLVVERVRDARKLLLGAA